jgi:hypothetical protein
MRESHHDVVVVPVLVFTHTVLIFNYGHTRSLKNHARPARCDMEEFVEAYGGIIILLGYGTGTPSILSMSETLKRLKVGCIRALLERCFSVFSCAHDPFIVHLLLTVQTEKFRLSYSGFPSKKGANTRYDMFWTKVISKFLLDLLMFYSKANCTFYY